MRRALLLLPVPLAALAFACEDDPSSGGGGGLPEAGAFDASTPEYDAGQPATDTGPQPAPGVTVTVATRKGPKAGATVVFHDASGAVIEAKQTGPDGKATSSASPLPAMATAVVTDRELLTWTGVQAGDVLPVLAEDNAPIGTYDVTLPGLSDAGVVQSYLARVGRCEGSGNGTAPIPVLVEEYCRGTGAVLVHALDDASEPVAFSSKKSVAGAADGGTTAIATAAYVAPVDVTTSVANAPSPYGSFKLTQVASGTPFTEQHFFEGSSSTFKVAAGFAEALNAVVTISGSDPGAQRAVGKRLAPAGSVALDFASALPELAEATITNDAQTPRRPTIAWKGATTAAKGGVARFVFFPPASESPTRWTIVVAPGATTVQAPALPAGTLAAALPADDAGAAAWQDDPEIVFADSDLLADYAAFRKLQGVLVGAASQALEFDDVVLPQNGSVRLTRFRYTPAR